MNTQQLRQSLRDKWLHYYAENRQWITRMRVWVECDGQRRPSSSFILATLSILEPQLNQLLPLIVDLSNNPDRIVMALGLNLNPDDMLAQLQSTAAETTLADEAVKLLPAAPVQAPVPSQRMSKLLSKLDESCQGGRFGSQSLSDEA